MSTFLLLIQDYTASKGLEVPTSVFASTTAELRQFVKVFNMVGRDLHRRMDWQLTKRRITFTSIANEDQGLITSAGIVNSTDFDHIIPETFWNNTLRQQVFGPISDADWQQLKALVATSPLYQFKVYNNHLYVFGPLPAGHTLSFFYKIKSWMEVSLASGTYVDAVTADTNVPFWPDDVMLLGIDAFWRREKGLSFTAQMADYEVKIADISGVDNVKPVLSMDSSGRVAPRPGVIVPYGNWTA